ncbi:YgfZ/GcvT domain-containing protein [Pseudomonas putida]|uniref:CAF17-like 4Fe-4S cluster assembly/insertion protein YgfZ n=1 Tax=Pseudomonas putida TaxID=303 RepID=UPI0037CB772E
MPDSAFYSPLSHEGILAVRGSDAGKFLQGQLTCNINYLSLDHASLGARCMVKGRMQSSFRILPEGNGYLLAMASELLDAQMADLKKYAVFSKATLTDESAAWTRFGLQGGQAALQALQVPLPADAPAGTTVRNAGLIAVAVSPGRVELWVPAEQAGSVGDTLAASMAEASLNDWLLGQIRAGIGQVTGPTRELFIPQMINLQALDGVSFKKGCYTGQEIVARMQYLGKLKRRQYRLALEQQEVPLAGTEIFSPTHGSSVGEVVLAASTGHGCELLAVLSAEAVADDNLHLASLGGPRLTLLNLPYELDRDQEIQR